MHHNNCLLGTSEISYAGHGTVTAKLKARRCSPRTLVPSIIMFFRSHSRPLVKRDDLSIQHVAFIHATLCATQGWVTRYRLSCHRATVGMIMKCGNLEKQYSKHVQYFFSKIAWTLLELSTVNPDLRIFGWSKWSSVKPYQRMPSNNRKDFIEPDSTKISYQKFPAFTSHRPSKSTPFPSIHGSVHRQLNPQYTKKCNLEF